MRSNQRFTRKPGVSQRDKLGRRGDLGFIVLGFSVLGGIIRRDKGNGGFNRLATKGNRRIILAIAWRLTLKGASHSRGPQGKALRAVL